MPEHKHPGSLCDRIPGGNGFPFLGSAAGAACLAGGAGAMQAAAQCSLLSSRSCTSGWCGAGARVRAVLLAAHPSAVCTMVFSPAELAMPCHFCLFLKQTFLACFCCEFPACPWFCLRWRVESAFPGVFIFRAQSSRDKGDGGGFRT